VRWVVVDFADQLYRWNNGRFSSESFWFPSEDGNHWSSAIEPTVVAAEPAGDKEEGGYVPSSRRVRPAFDDGQFLVVDINRYSPADAEARAIS
jgi:hypothetical protein